MADQSRIEDLRRRVERDPASIAFAQLAEEYRRAGRAAEAVETCRAGLALHPGYLSARVTLGRGLIELGNLEEGLQELELVLKSAPENLAAIRGVAEVHHRQGDIPKALEYFQAALALAKNDPDLQETVGDLTRQLAPKRGPDTGDGLSLEQMHSLFAQHAPPPVPRPAPAAAPTPVPVRAPEPEEPEEAVEPALSAHDAAESSEAEHAEELLVSEHPSASLSPEQEDEPFHCEDQESSAVEHVDPPLEPELFGEVAASEHPAESAVEGADEPLEGERPAEFSSVAHADSATELETVENEPFDELNAEFPSVDQPDHLSETARPVDLASEVAQFEDQMESSTSEEAPEFSLEPPDEPLEPESGTAVSTEALDESDYFEHSEDLRVEQPELSLEPEHPAESSSLQPEPPAAPQPPKRLLALEGFLAEIHAARSERRA